MFTALKTKQLTRRAEAYFRKSEPIPLDLFAALMERGIDVTELERTTRNG